MDLDLTDVSEVALFGRRSGGRFAIFNMNGLRDVAGHTRRPELAPSQQSSDRTACDRHVSHTVAFPEASGGSGELGATRNRFFVGPLDERWDLVMVIGRATVAHVI